MDCSYICLQSLSFAYIFLQSFALHVFRRKALFCVLCKALFCKERKDCAKLRANLRFAKDKHSTKMNQCIFLPSPPTCGTQERDTQKQVGEKSRYKLARICKELCKEHCKCKVRRNAWNFGRKKKDAWKDISPYWGNKKRVYFFALKAFTPH